MANEVEITITAKDLTGPAFAAALGKMALMKQAAKELGGEFHKIGGIEFDVNKAMGALTQLKSRIQALGIADIADVNIPQGRIVTQLILLKRLIQQQKISDLLDVNVNTQDLSIQLDKIAAISETIPVKFDVSALKLPAATESVPVKFDVSSAPGLPGPSFGSETVKPISQATLDSWHKMGDDTFRLNSFLIPLKFNLSSVGNALHSAAVNAYIWADAAKVAWRSSSPLEPLITRLWAAVGNSIAPAAMGSRALLGLSAAGGFAGGVFGFLGARFHLFGGILDGLGLKFLATIRYWHLIADAAIEFLGVLLPASVALAAFGVGAAPTIRDISKSMQTLHTVATGLNQQIYPMTGAFDKLEKAVKPNVMVMFGEAVVVATQDSGRFVGIAQAAGNALQQLSARAAVALTNGGIGAFVKDGPRDLAQIGDIVGNIGGIIGGILKVIPGYAQVLLAAVDQTTKGLEALVQSPVGEWVIRIGLAFHGALIWLGFFSTLTVIVGNGLITLASKFGLATAGALAFNGVLFGAGIKQFIQGIGLLGGELLTLGSSADIAAAGTLTLEGAWTAITAINPLVWVGLLVGGLVALVLWMGKASSATQQYDDNIKAAISNAPVSQFSVDIVMAQVDAIQKLADATHKLGTIQQFTYGVTGGKGAQVHKITTEAYQKELNVIAGYQQELGTLSTAQGNYNTLIQAAGGDLGFLNEAGITSNQIFTANATQLAQYRLEVEGAKAAFDSLALGTGRAAAAQNALGKAGAASFKFLTEQVPAIQNFITAQDNLTTLLLGGRQAFIAFEQGVMTVGADARVAGSSLNLLNKQSLQMASDFYTVLIPAAQSLFDKLNLQAISQKDLTKVVATSSVQMLQFAGKNTEARATIVALINNALGPGTVSLKTLDSWVKKNQTSLSGFNAIVAGSTIKVGTLAGVLASDLNAQFEKSLFDSSGAAQAIKKMTDAIVHGGTSTAAFKGARAQLIRDLESTGLSAQDATTLVNNLQKKIDAMHGKTVPINATDGVSAVVLHAQSVIDNLTGKSVPVSAFFTLPGHAAGGLIGPVPHAASGGARSGTVLVGEMGPEFVTLPYGSRVWPNGTTPPGMRGGGGRDGSSAPTEIRITLELGDSFKSSGLSQQQLEDIRYTVRTKGGGDVQRAFGKV